MNRALINPHVCVAIALLPVLVLVRSTGADSSPVDSDPVVFLYPAHAVPTLNSASLTQKAWAALEGLQYDQTILIAEEIVSRFGALAHQQQQRLGAFAPDERAAQYGALNDVATALFIKGKVYRLLGKENEARQAYMDIMQNYRFAQCWDTKGWFWKVAESAQDEIDSMDYGVDYGDYTSETLTSKAWKAFQKGRYEAVELYTRKCIELFAETAMQMQKELNDFPPKGWENDYWALNDVGTSLLIRGKALQRQRRNREAAKVFNEIIEAYPYALCWNPKGYYWRVAEAAQRSLAVYTP
ncbi:MAG: tetratricopeptide repeat protein [Spartobacteria bacterium]|nr:tetratricopeptide repeat protein [Spartobacteria bacterium]